MINKKIVSGLIVFFTIFILVLGVPSFLALFNFVYFAEAEKTSTYLVLENAEVLYEEVHGFLLLKNPLPAEFTIEEASHMRDVRLIFILLRSLSLIFLFLLLACVFLIKSEAFKDFKSYKKFSSKKLLNLFVNKIKKGTLISLIIMVTLLALVLLNFSVSFNAFHNVFFPQGNWIFPTDSLLITLFPESFLINASKKIFIVTLILATALYSLLYFQEKKFDL